MKQLVKVNPYYFVMKFNYQICKLCQLFSLFINSVFRYHLSMYNSSWFWFNLESDMVIDNWTTLHKLVQMEMNLDVLLQIYMRLYMECCCKPLLIPLSKQQTIQFQFFFRKNVVELIGNGIVTAFFMQLDIFEKKQPFLL